VGRQGAGDHYEVGEGSSERSEGEGEAGEGEEGARVWVAGEGDWSTTRVLSGHACDAHAYQVIGDASPVSSQRARFGQATPGRFPASLA
jgi:hypothetical protein